MSVTAERIARAPEEERQLREPRELLGADPHLRAHAARPEEARDQRPPRALEAPQMCEPVANRGLHLRPVAADLGRMPEEARGTPLALSTLDGTKNETVLRVGPLEIDLPRLAALYGPTNCRAAIAHYVRSGRYEGRRAVP